MIVNITSSLGYIGSYQQYWYRAIISASGDILNLGYRSIRQVSNKYPTIQLSNMFLLGLWREYVMKVDGNSKIKERTCTRICAQE